MKALNESRPAEPRLRALWSRGSPSPTYVLRRGDYLLPGDFVEPGIPAVLAGVGGPYAVQPPTAGGLGTGRRLAFAKWTTDPRNPLTARVMVNRIWMHHFGQGLVRTPDNFGKMGAPPSHPELLDWLAVQFVEHDWSVKYVHKLLMTSNAYRQTSQVADSSRANDPENHWLSRMPVQRMTAEVLRDSLLQVAGELDDRPFGPPDGVTRRADGLVTSQRSAAGWRRSIYVQHRRTTLPTLLENFDSPQMGPNCIQRGMSIVAPQALNLLNGTFLHELSHSFAQRIRNEAGTDPEQQVRLIYLSAYGREPDAAESTMATNDLEVLTQRWLANEVPEKEQLSSEDAKATAQLHALESFCHAVLNSAEFVFID